MKSVCIDARLIHAPGIGTYLKNLLRHFRETPWKWSALIGVEHAEILSAWDYIEPIVISSEIYSIREQWELSLKIPRVDVFWSPHFNIPCGPIRAAARLATIHDVFHLAHSYKLRSIERIYAKILMRSARRLSDHVITVSAFSKDEIEKHVGGTGPITVIHHGIDPLFSPEKTESSISILSKYGIRGRFVLYVGSFKKHKNIKGLIDAFSILAVEHEDMQLAIVGGSTSMRHSEDVKQLCIAYPELQEKILVVGRVLDEELPHFYRHATLFVFPSLYEGFGFPPMEAMRAGCPTIVARTGAMPEICGDGVLYVDPHAPRHIAQVMAELMRNDAQQKLLSHRGMLRAQQFCWKQSAEKHCAVIESLFR